MDAFISAASRELQQAGYIIDFNSPLGGLQSLLYACSEGVSRMGAAKVEEHFLFIDWDHTAFSRLDKAKEVYRQFSAFVNKGIKTPHALRMKIPSLALVAIREEEFPQDVVHFTQNLDFNPWYGGETGQLILVDTFHREIISLVSFSGGRYPRPGAFPLRHAGEVIRQVCGPAFQIAA